MPILNLEIKKSLFGDKTSTIEICFEGRKIDIFIVPELLSYAKKDKK